MSNKLGWIPDIPDHRDFVYAAAPKAYPSMVNLNSQCPPVYDQRTLSSCVGNGVSMVCQFNAIRQKLKKSNIMPSRLFVYWNARAYEGTTNVDEGCQIRDAIKGVAKLGIPIASYWPYILKNVNVQPIPSAYKEGANHKAIQYARLENTNLNILKGCLAEGFPFVFGAAIYQSFMTPAVAESGIVPMPGKESMLGGHAMCCVGYSDSTQSFIVRNSWGTKWGDKGNCYIPYAYLTSGDLAADFWTVRVVS